MPGDDDPVYFAFGSNARESDALECAPIYAGRNILIMPNGAAAPESSGRMVICMDSDLAFGDGRHPTTVLCMTLIEEYLDGLSLPEKKNISMLDIGTGTGILAILASRMGTGNILALDIDPDSISNASELAVQNGCTSIEFRLMDAAFLTPLSPYGLVTANLLPPILRTVIPLAAKLSSPGAPVIVSGIGDTSSCEMEELMYSSGFKIVKHITSGWWHAYMLMH